MGNELNVDNIPWSILRTLTLNSTPKTKLKAFQIKLNYRAIVTNIALCDFSLVESENCTFCNQHRETLVYLFCDCSCVRIIWQDLQNWLSNKLEANFNFTKTDLLFGVNLSCNNEILNCSVKPQNSPQNLKKIFEII